MHISDGVLSASVCVGSAAVAVALTAYSLKKIENDQIPGISVMTAALFVTSLIHVKLGPASGHLILNGLAGIILGMSAFPAILVALLFQAIMFQHGGITTLGVNSLAMGIPALLAHAIFRLRKYVNSERNYIDGFFSFFAGAIAVILSAVFVSIFLITTGKEFIGSAKILMGVHIPIAVVEGIITGFIISFIRKVNPEILSKVKSNW